MLALIALIPPGSMGCGTGSASRERAEMLAKIDSLMERSEFDRRELLAEVDSLRHKARLDRERTRHPIHSVEVQWLEGRGLRAPIRQLVSSLRQRPDLIPFQNPSPESQFGFHSDEAITVLNRRYAWAAVDDGHGQGVMLLEFAVPDSTKIEWRVVWASRD